MIAGVRKLVLHENNGRQTARNEGLHYDEVSLSVKLFWSILLARLLKAVLWQRGQSYEAYRSREQSESDWRHVNTISMSKAIEMKHKCCTTFVRGVSVLRNGLLYYIYPVRRQWGQT